MVPGIVRWGWQHAQRMCISHRLFVSEMLPTTGQHDTTRMGCGRGMRRPEADRKPDCVVDPSTLGGYVTGVGVQTRVVSGVRPVV